MICQRCGGTVPLGIAACPACGQPMPKGTTSSGEEVIATVVPFRNMPALIGYYLAVFSLLPCIGLPLGIAAVICGVLGLRKQREQPTAKGSVHAWVGILLGGLAALVWGALLVLMGFGILSGA